MKVHWYKFDFSHKKRTLSSPKHIYACALELFSPILKPVLVKLEDELLYSLNAVRNMEVIDISTGSKIGYVKDFKVDINTKKIISIFLPSPVKSWFNKAEDIELSWDKIVKIGVDVLIVDASSVIEEFKENNV